MSDHASFVCVHNPAENLCVIVPDQITTGFSTGSNHASAIVKPVINQRHIKQKHSLMLFLHLILGKSILYSTIITIVSVSNLASFIPGHYPSEPSYVTVADHASDDEKAGKTQILLSVST